MGFVNRMDQNVAKYRIGIRMKKWWCSLFSWMVDIVLQDAWLLHFINSGKGDESLPLLAFRRDVNAIFWNIQRKENYHRAM